MGRPEDDWGQTEIMPSTSHFEFWAGAQAFKHAWSLYSGTTVAPFTSIQQDGLRLRMVGGYGAYMLCRPACGRRRLADREFQGHGGVYRRSGRIPQAARAPDGEGLCRPHGGAVPTCSPTIPRRPFVGRASAARSRSRPGGTLATAPGPRSMSRGARSMTAMRRGGGSAGVSCRPCRLGSRRAVPATGSATSSASAGFLRYEWEGGELSASGGLSNDKLWQGVGRPDVTQSSAPFATLSWLARF